MTRQELNDAADLGFLLNCHLIARRNEVGPMFKGHADGHITPHLNGYVIIPTEQFESMRRRGTLPVVLEQTIDAEA